MRQKIGQLLRKGGNTAKCLALHRRSLLWGKPRRFIYSVILTDRARRSMASRQGACARCGACCKLGITCSFFKLKDGLPSCSVHGRTLRPPNCSNFPISPADIDDRNRVMPERSCGYSWPE